MLKRGPLQGILDFAFFSQKTTKVLDMPWNLHFWADFQVSYHFGNLMPSPSQGFIENGSRCVDQ